MVYPCSILHDNVGKMIGSNTNIDYRNSTATALFPDRRMDD
jgi:hypothetical protein